MKFPETLFSLPEYDKMSMIKTELFSILFIERGDTMVELDQFKTTLNTYKEPLVEVRDSL